MRCKPVPKFCCDSTNFSERFGGEGLQLVTVFYVTCKWEHFGAEAHESDAVLFVPPQHLDNIACVGQA